MRALTVTTLLLALPAVASAQAERSVQLRSADFEAGWIELFNFGTTDVALDGWRLGSADADETLFTATAGLNGLTIEAGTSLFIHANDDAPAADPDRVDASVVGGLASPLAADGYRLALFDLTGGLTLDPADGTQLADYIQWATGGGPPTTTFTGTAVSEGLWTADGDFVVPASNTRRVDLTVVQDIEAHGPADYSLIGPTFYDEHLGLDLSGDRFNPTVLNLPIGDATLVLAQQGDFEVGGRDLDYVTITVPDGQQLTNIFLDAYIADPFNQAFYGIQEGTTFTTDEDNTTPGDLFGGAIIGPFQIGQDILPIFANFQDGSFVNPVPAGTYTIWLNQTGPVSEGIFRFVTESVVGSAYCTPSVENSTGGPSELGASGSNSVAANDLVLECSSFPPSVMCLAVVSPNQGFYPNIGGSQGALCLDLPLDRLATQILMTDAGGAVQFPIDLTAIPQGIGTTAVLPGETLNFQVWHRDLVGGMQSSNLSNGLEITFN